MCMSMNNGYNAKNSLLLTIFSDRLVEVGFTNWFSTREYYIGKIFLIESFSTHILHAYASAKL